jgi:ATP-binding cassette subfamily B protein RaxB
VPVILQSQRADCGSVALRMVAAYHGSAGPSHERARGMTVADLAADANRLGFQTRALRLDIEDIHRLDTPAILHWRMNHYVVLVRARGRRMLIHDPAAGRRLVRAAELDEAFSGVALELKPAVRFGRDRGVANPGLFTFVRRFRYLPRYLLLMGALLIVSQLLSLMPAIVTQLLVDEVVLAAETSWLWRLLAGLALVMIAAAGLEAWRQSIALRSGLRLSIDATTSVVGHLHSLPADYFRCRQPGEILSRLKSLPPLRAALTEHLVSAVVQATVVLSTCVLMFFYSPLLAAATLAGLIVMTLCSALTLPARRRLNAEILSHRAREDSTLLATMRAIGTLDWYGLLPRSLDIWQRYNTDAVNAAAREGRIMLFGNLAVSIVASADQIVFLGLGLTVVAGQHASLGVLFAFMSLRGRLSSAVAGLIDVATRLYLVRTHRERLADITAAPARRPDSGRGERRPIRGQIDVSNVSFRFDDGGALLEDYSLTIRPGEHVALVGPSGCGKSTLLEIILGRRKPAAGCVKIDGLELDLWNRDALSRQIAVVFQDDALFAGSIAENICGFAAATDYARMREAARWAEIWDTIRRLPMRHETRVDELGGMLSGGERQRLLIARALYRQPRILLLDEATRSLDPVNESRVLAAVARLRCTTLHVTHRPAAAERADRCVVMRSPVDAAPRAV